MRIARNKLIIIMVAVLLTLWPTTAKASEISLRNTNINTSSISLSFSGSKANCSASLTAYAANTTYVQIDMTLYKYSGGAWNEVSSWSNSANRSYVSLSKSVAVSSGTYKLKCTYTANKEVIVKSTQKIK